jgi:hypothetical protein
MAKNRSRSGLHKEISSIFDGVPIPKGHDLNQTFSKPTTGRIGYVPANTPPPPQPTPKAPQPEHVSDKARKSKVGKQTVAIKTGRPSGKLFAKKRDATPARQKVMAALIPALLVAIVAVLAYNSGIISTIDPTVTTPPAVSTAALAPSSFQIDWHMPAVYNAPASDPMARDLSNVIVTTSTAEVGLVVTGIVYTQDTPNAIVGTQIVQVGQQVLGATVVAINPDSVVFEMDGKKWTQKVRKSKDGK